MSRRVIALLTLLSLVVTGCAKGAPPSRERDGSTPSPSAVAHEPPHGKADERVAAVFTHGAAINLAIAGDSTGAGALNWPTVWMHMVATRDPGIRLVLRDWQRRKAAYAPDLVLAPGSGPGSTGITLLNGSAENTRLDYHLTHLEDLYPNSTPIDVLVLNMGHNYEATDPASFQRTLDEFLAAYSQIHPESAIWVTSQNPQFLRNTARKDTHAARQASLQAYATARDYTYLPVWERWNALPEHGRSMVARDGVHPTQTDAGKTSPLTVGSVFWADLFRQMVDAKR